MTALGGPECDEFRGAIKSSHADASWQWRKWAIVASVLLLSHASTAWYYGQRFTSGRVYHGSTPVNLDETPDQWISKLGATDASVYLSVAQNVAAGRGVVNRVKNSEPPRYEPFYWWAPGTPLIYGGLLNLAGNNSMWVFFWFSAAAQLLFGILAVATAALWTSNPASLAIVAFCTGFCPPMQHWFYGENLTSSELAGLVPLSAALFALSKAFLHFRAATITRSDDSPGFWRQALSVPTWTWFLISGVLLGSFSLIRDCGHGFALFVAVFVVARALMFTRRQLSLAVLAALLLMVGDVAIRAPVKQWNFKRLHKAIVCTGTDATIWQLGPWEKHDAYDWYIPLGLGFGEYLDPYAAQRVSDYYSQGKKWPKLYSAGQLAQAIAKRPFDALQFKLVRQPVLWLGMSFVPKFEFHLLSIWCLALYSALAWYLYVQWRHRRYLPETLYLYLLLSRTLYCVRR